MNRIAIRYNKIRLIIKAAIRILPNIVKFSCISKYRKIKMRNSMIKALCNEGICKIDAKELTKTYLTDYGFKLEYKKGSTDGLVEEKNKKSK